MANTDQTNLTQVNGLLFGVIEALKGLRTGPPPLDETQVDIIRGHQTLKDRLAGPLLSAPTRPSIADFHPRQGKEGTEVTIFGQGFATVTDVKFDGMSTSNEAWSDITDSSLTVTVPKMDPSEVKLTVITAEGDPAISGDKFTVIASTTMPTGVAPARTSRARE